MNAPVRPLAPEHVLDLSIERGPDGRSRLADRHVRFPWSVGRVYPGPPGAPTVLIPQCAGAGLLSGDTLLQRISVKPDAALELLSQGAMLTYGRKGGAASVTDWRYDLQRGSTTRVVSEPYVLLDDADLLLRQTIYADPTASLVLAESITYAGNPARVRWQTQTTVCNLHGEVLFNERQRAMPEILRHLQRLPGAWSAFGTILVLTAAPAGSLGAVREAARDVEKTAYVSAAIIPGDIGICVRIAAGSGQGLREAMCHLTASVTPSCRHGNGRKSPVQATALPNAK